MVLWYWINCNADFVNIDTTVRDKDNAKVSPCADPEGGLGVRTPLRFVRGGVLCGYIWWVGEGVQRLFLSYFYFFSGPLWSPVFRHSVNILKIRITSKFKGLSLLRHTYYPWLSLKCHLNVYFVQNYMILHHSRSWQTLESWTTIVWNIIHIQHGSEELWPGHRFLICVHCGPWRYDLGSRSWHILGSWTISVWNIIQIQLCFDELWPGHGFSVYVHFDLDLGHMTLCQGHDTPLGHRQQLCEILSRSNFIVRSYGLDTDFRYMYTVTLTLEIWPWVKFMTHPWVMYSNCVKHYPHPTWHSGVIARTRILGMCALWPWHIEDMNLGQGHDTPLCHGKQLCEILSRSNLALMSYGPDTDLHCDLDLRDLTLGQGHGTPLGHRQ